MYPNVKYELHQYEGFIGSVSHGTDRDKGGYGRDAALKEQIKTEVDRIKQTFIHEVFTFGDERHLERYIQYHQQSLIRLMDETVGLANTIAQKKKSYLLCYHGLEELLSFIEKYFLKYFDQDAKAPEAYITITKKDLLSNFDELRNSLADKSGDSRITDVMLYAIRKVIDDDQKSEITYRKVMYAKALQKELSNLLSNSKQESDINEELRNLMYYFNYNSMKSFTYHTHYIDILLSQTESRTEMIEKLSYILKKINQVQIKPGIGYNMNAPTLKIQLNNYLIEEIEHLQRVHQLTSASGLKPLDALLSSVKIQLELSVAQIAYLIKVLIEVDIIVNRNVTELLRFLSRFLVSKKAETVSFDSLRAKYYNVEQGTQVAVRKLLLKMMAWIDKN